MLVPFTRGKPPEPSTRIFRALHRCEEKGVLLRRIEVSKDGPVEMLELANIVQIHLVNSMTMKEQNQGIPFI